MKKQHIILRPFAQIFFFLMLLLNTANVHAHEDFLLETQSPYTLPMFNTEFRLTASAESGDIPGFFFFPQINWSFTDWLEIDSLVTLGLFHEIPEFRFAEYQISLKARVFNFRYFKLYPYILFHQTVGDPIIEEYTGTANNVHSIVSQHTDSGIDFGGGFTGSINIPKMHGGFFFSADYTRNELRSYNDYLQTDELNKNRIFFQVAPYLKPPVFKNSKTTLTLSIQHRFTFWFERGFMFDLLHQATFQFAERGNLYIGGSVPIVGGEVYKAFVGGTIQFNPTKPKNIRLVIQDLYFPPDKSILFGSQNKQSELNKRRIDKLYRQLKRYPEYDIVVEGHTSFVYWNDPVKGPAEQKNVLIPLSRARARAVADALVERGIPRNRIKAVGLGGEYPKVPFGIKSLQHKNRRVEVELTKRKN